MTNIHSKKMERAELGIDGNCSFALLGENLQEGEAEFVDVNQGEDEPLFVAQNRASRIAFRKLQKRMKSRGIAISYFLGKSHPFYCE